MMHLFSLIAEQVRSKQELFEQEGKIMQALLNNGYRLHEADAALTLMQNLVQNEVEHYFDPRRPHPFRFRTMSREERDRFTADAFGFVLKLSHLGIISEEQREDVFEKAMNMYTGRIDLELIKTLLAFTLFAGPPDREHHNSDARRTRNTSWN